VVRSAVRTGGRELPHPLPCPTRCDSYSWPRTHLAIALHEHKLTHGHRRCFVLCRCVEILERARVSSKRISTIPRSRLSDLATLSPSLSCCLPSCIAVVHRRNSFLRAARGGGHGEGWVIASTVCETRCFVLVGPPRNVSMQRSCVIHTHVHPQYIHTAFPPPMCMTHAISAGHCHDRTFSPRPFRLLDL
jgi:hypothetical protein